MTGVAITRYSAGLIMAMLGAPACEDLSLHRGDGARDSFRRGGSARRARDTVINGAIYKTWSSAEGAAGNVYYDRSYVSFQFGLCLEALLPIHTANPAMFGPCTKKETGPKEINLDKVVRDLLQPLYTLRFGDSKRRSDRPLICIEDGQPISLCSILSIVSCSDPSLGVTAKVGRAWRRES